MRENCVIFATKERKELRCVFDPDGTPFFCGPDLATIAGYETPRKAVTSGNAGVNRIDTVLRKVPWDNGMKRGRCAVTCFSAENAVKFLCRRPAPYAAIRWFEDEVIPKAQEMGEEVARSFMEWPESHEKAPEPRMIETTAREPKRQQKAISVSIMERLDAIILECALLKQELCRTK